MNDRVILVPGMGLGGLELVPLAVRLRLIGYRVTIFWHWTGRRHLEESARRLWEVVSRQRGDVVHLVGHSLGGLVALQMLANHQWDRRGRIVTMGTPHAGIVSARRLAQLPGGRRLLWPGVVAAAEGKPIPIPSGRELGVLAGNKNPFTNAAGPDPPSDTVIGVDESRHPGSHGYVIVSETHVGMLFSALVARHIERFLREGRFQ